MNRPDVLFKNKAQRPPKQFTCRVPDSLVLRAAEIDKRLARHGEKLSWSAATLESLGKACDKYEKFCDQLDEESEQPK